jgi:hypothetical protein
MKKGIQTPDKHKPRIDFSFGQEESRVRWGHVTFVEKRQLQEFDICLSRDKMTRGEFVRNCIDLYISRDKSFNDVLDKMLIRMNRNMDPDETKISREILKKREKQAELDDEILGEGDIKSFFDNVEENS